MKKKPTTLGEKRIKDLALLGANEEYREDMDKLLKKYSSISKDNIILDGKRELEFIQDPKALEMTKDYIELMNKYDIGWLFYMLMPYVIQKGYFSILANGEKMKFDFDEATKHVLECSGFKVVEDEKECITLKLYKGIKTKDAQKLLAGALKNLNKESVRKSANNQDRDIEIVKLKDKSKKTQDIVKIINEKYPKQQISYQDVSRLASRTKTRAKKNVPNKDS